MDLWIASESGEPLVLSALPGTLLEVLSVVPFGAMLAASMLWANSIDGRRIRDRERGRPRSRALDKEQWVYWALAPIAILASFALVVWASWAAANRLD